MDETQFSLYYLGITVIIVMGNLQAELVTAPFSVYRQRYRGEDRAEYAGSVLCHQLILCVVSMLGVAVMLGATALGLAPAALNSTLYVMFAAAPIILLRASIRAFSFASYRFWAAVWIDLAVGVSQFCGIALLWHFDLLSVPAAYAMMGGACTAGILVWRLAKPEPIAFAPKTHSLGLANELDLFSLGVSFPDHRHYCTLRRAMDSRLLPWRVIHWGLWRLLHLGGRGDAFCHRSGELPHTSVGTCVHRRRSPSTLDAIATGRRCLWHGDRRRLPRVHRAGRPARPMGLR